MSIESLKGITRETDPPHFYKDTRSPTRNARRAAQVLLEEAGIKTRWNDDGDVTYDGPNNG